MSVDKTKLLLEEYKLITDLWKFNRDIGLKRFQINFLINSGIMAVNSAVATILTRTQDFPFELVVSFIVLTAFLGLVFSFVWLTSSKRHHRYIYLKMRQGLAVEKKLNELVEGGALMMFKETHELLAPKGEGGMGYTTIDGQRVELGRFEGHSSSWIASGVPFIFVCLWLAFMAIFLSFIVGPLIDC